jgi:rhamnosyltransferase
MVKASIVIPTKNGEATLPECLNRIFDQDYPPGFEVIVIDSGSTDNTLAIIENFPVRLLKISPEEFGHGKTRNYGAEQAKGDYVVFISQDATPKSNLWLKSLTQSLSKPEVAGASARQIPREDAIPMERHWLNYFYPPERKVVQIPPGTGKVSVHYYDFFSNVSSAIKREVLLKYKFPDDIVMSEDKAWCRKVLMAGYAVVYEAEAEVYHSHNYGLKLAFQHFFASGVSYAQMCEYRDESPLATFIKLGIQYFLSEMRFLRNNGYIRYIPYAIIYDALKFSGRTLGKNHRYFPRFINVRLCQNGHIYRRLCCSRKAL